MTPTERGRHYGDLMRLRGVTPDDTADLAGLPAETVLDLLDGESVSPAVELAVRLALTRPIPAESRTRRRAEMQKSQTPKRRAPVRDACFVDVPESVGA